MLLRYDGIYCKINGENSHLLRFYEDNTVVYACIGGMIGEGISSLFPTGTWSGKDYKTCHGGYVICGHSEVKDPSVLCRKLETDYSGDDIKIWVRFYDDYGESVDDHIIDFDGKVCENGLIVHEFDHCTDKRRKGQRYFFFKDSVIEYLKANS